MTAAQSGNQSATGGNAGTGDLASKHCVPCEGGTPPLDPAVAGAYLRQVPGWELADEGRKLVRAFKFGNFVEAVSFVNAITPIAEAEGHHPDLLVKWGEVRVELWTHAAGGLTENDFILAAKIDQIKRP